METSVRIVEENTREILEGFKKKYPMALLEKKTPEESAKGIFEVTSVEHLKFLL